MGLIGSERAKQSAESCQEGGGLEGWGLAHSVGETPSGPVTSSPVSAGLSQPLVLLSLPFVFFFFFFSPLPLDFCLSLCDLHANTGL